MTTIVGVYAQQGEIIYTDFEPDSLVELKDHNLYPQQLLLIDIDNNGQPDLSVYQSSNSGGWWFYVDAFSDWEFVSYPIDAQIPPMNEIVSWNTSLDWLPYFYQGQDAIDEKFAIRHKVGNDIYYGWFRIYLLMNDTDWPWVALDKIAFCTIPNYPLRWGQTSFTGVEENEPSAFAIVHPNPTTGLVTIEGKDLKHAEVLNTLGQRVATATGKGEMLQIDIATLPAGVYFVNVTDGEGRKCVRKVVKE